MGLQERTKRRLIANAFAILAVALVMWLFTSKRGGEKTASTESISVLKVAVDLAPNGLQVDSLAELSGRPKELLDLLLSNQEKELVPFTTRAEALVALMAGEVQLYATSMPYSSVGDMDGITATEWLYTSRFSLLFHEGDADWASRFSSDSTSTVVVSEGDQAAVTILENLSELTYPSLRIEVREASPLELGAELSKRRITYLMCDSAIAESIVAVDSTLQVSHDVGFDLHQVWLVRDSDDRLRNMLDTAIVAHRGSREWMRIINSNK